MFKLNLSSRFGGNIGTKNKQMQRQIDILTDIIAYGRTLYQVSDTNFGQGTKSVRKYPLFFSNLNVEVIYQQLKDVIVYLN